MHIIIKGKTKIGKVRSEQEENLRKEWGPTMSDEQLEKMKFIEKRVKEKTGSDSNFVGTNETDEIK